MSFIKLKSGNALFLNHWMFCRRHIISSPLFKINSTNINTTKKSRTLHGSSIFAPLSSHTFFLCFLFLYHIFGMVEKPLVHFRRTLWKAISFQIACINRREDVFTFTRKIQYHQAVTALCVCVCALWHRKFRWAKWQNLLNFHFNRFTSLSSQNEKHFAIS